MKRENLALIKAFEAVGRTSEQERLHQAATDIYNDDAVANLRELVHSDFATISTENTNESSDSEEDKLFRKIIEDVSKRKLTREATKDTLSTLKKRFDSNSHLHEGWIWGKVSSALEFTPYVLWSVNQMEEQGHMPDVFNVDDRGFDIGTCSEETPAGSTNCVYDTQAIEWLKENRPNTIFNGSAVEMAKNMGVSLMSPDQYKILQGKGKFDSKTWSWLLTDETTRKYGDALSGDRNEYGVIVIPSVAYMHSDDLGFRLSLRVSWLKLPKGAVIF